MCDLILEAHRLSQASMRLHGGVHSKYVEGTKAPRVWQPAIKAQRPRINDTLTQTAASTAGTRLHLLGTAGGPVWWPGSERQGIASAVVVNDAVYLVDCGEGWGRQYRNANLGARGDFDALESLRGVFLTHLHSDHTIDYPNLLLHGLYNGLPNRSLPVQVYGPGRRGPLPPIFGRPGKPPAVMNPPNPTPGIVDMTDSILRAFATDLNDRMRDNLKPDVRSLVEVNDIRLPAHVTDDPNGTPSPPMDPIEVYEDENVRVSCTLVDHAPVFPAFGFRLDTADGSVVFSGDTGFSGSPNLVKLARGADVLVHEVIDRRWVNSLFPQPQTPDQASLINHLLSSHTEIADVGKVAEAAGVATLVLSHLVPGNNPDELWLEAGNGFSGRLVVGRDLDVIQIGRSRP